MEVSIREIQNEDLPLLQKLLERCSDYLIFQDEEAVKSSAALDLFNVKPEGVKDENKILLGIFDELNQMVGVMDIVKGYPDPKTLNLGLMLMEPSSRSKGIGHKAYNALEEGIVREQFNKIRLGVLLGNQKGINFWKKVGYYETGEIKTYSGQNRVLSKKFLVLEKHIGSECR